MRGFRAARSFAFIAAFVGAERSHAAPDTVPPPAPASCGDKVAEFQSWVAKLPAPDNVLRYREIQSDAPADPNLVVGDGAVFARNETSPSVEMLRRSIRIIGDGTQVNDVAELRPLLRDAAGKKPDAATPRPPLLLGIDRDRRWSEIVELVNTAAEAGFSQLDFVLQTSVKIAPPPSAEDKDARRILAAALDERSRLAAIEIDRILKKCDGSREVMGRMASFGGQEKTKVLAAEMPPALRACDCATTPRDLMTLLWVWADPDQDGAIHREFIAARVAIAKGKQQATTVKANKTARWSETAAQVVAASKPGTPAVVRFESSAR
jgi:hypothetical protein